METDGTGIPGGYTPSVTPLMRATLSGHVEMVDLLLLCGKHSIGYQDPRSGRTAYICACQGNHPDIVEALIKAGCDTHAMCLDSKVDLVRMRQHRVDGHGREPWPGSFSSKRMTGGFIAYFLGHREVVSRIYRLLDETAASQLSDAAVDDWRDAEMLLGKMDAASNPERSRLIRVAEMAKEAGNSALKRQDPADAVRQYTLAVEALEQIDTGGSAVEKLQVQMRKGGRDSAPSARLLAICLTNRGVARLAEGAPNAALSPESMADFRAAIVADAFYGKAYYRICKTFGERIEAKGLTEAESSAISEELQRTLEVGCHLSDMPALHQSKSASSLQLLVPSVHG